MRFPGVYVVVATLVGSPPCLLHRIHDGQDVLARSQNRFCSESIPTPAKCSPRNSCLQSMLRDLQCMKTQLLERVEQHEREDVFEKRQNDLLRREIEELRAVLKQHGIVYRGPLVSSLTNSESRVSAGHDNGSTEPVLGAGGGGGTVRAVPSRREGAGGGLGADEDFRGEHDDPRVNESLGEVEAQFLAQAVGGATSSSQQLVTAKGSSAQLPKTTSSGATTAKDGSTSPSSSPRSSPLQLPGGGTSTDSSKQSSSSSGSSGFGSALGGGARAADPQEEQSGGSSSSSSAAADMTRNYAADTRSYENVIYFMQRSLGNEKVQVQGLRALLNYVSGPAVGGVPPPTTTLSTMAISSSSAHQPPPGVGVDATPTGGPVLSRGSSTSSSDSSSEEQARMVSVVVAATIRAMRCFPLVWRIQRDGALLLAELSTKYQTAKSTLMLEVGRTLLPMLERKRFFQIVHFQDIVVASARLLAVLAQRWGFFRSSIGCLCINFCGGRDVEGDCCFCCTISLSCQRGGGCPVTGIEGFFIVLL